MAMTSEERSQRLAIKRAKFAEKELRHRVRPGIEQAIKRISERAAKMETSEMLQIAVMKMDLMTDDELAAFLTYPRHTILVSPDVARDIYDHGVRSIMNNPDQDEDDEIERPAA